MIGLGEVQYDLICSKVRYNNIDSLVIVEMTDSDRLWFIVLVNGLFVSM